MAYIITEPCVDVKDTACVVVCPVDCIHTAEGEKQLYIDPNVCIDCAACVDECPVEAIYMQSDVPSEWESYIDINSKFFETFVYPETDDGASDDAGKSKKKKQGVPEEFVQLPDAVGSSLRAPLGLITMLGQPILGAFSASFKSQLEEMAGNPRVFSAAVSTGINSLINLILYPLVLFFIRTKGDIANLFTPAGNLMIFLGITIAIAEGMFRFKAELTSTPDDEQARYGASFYGWIPSLFATPVLKAMRSVLVNDPAAQRTTMPGAVQTDGSIFFDDIKERYRRYGMVNRVLEMADYYRIEIEFPRWVPNSSAKETYELPDRMPHYDYEVYLSSPYASSDASPVPESVVTVQTYLPRDSKKPQQFVDPRFEKVVGRTSSFPDGFRNIFPIPGQPEDFHAKYRNRMLEIIVPKTGTYDDLSLEHPVHYAKLKG
jgi:NAD-dependent dihydropyrimidine dehydrogenase PreA subunit